MIPKSIILALLLYGALSLSLTKHTAHQHQKAAVPVSHKTHLQGFDSCPMTYIYDSITKSCKCPPNSFVNITGVCQQCPYPYVMDSSTQACITCQTNQLYNPITKKCECPPNGNIDFMGRCLICPIKTFWNNYYQSCIMCADDYIFNQTSNTCHCPINKPYMDQQGNCIACSYPRTWIFQTLTCFGCQNGQIADYSTFRCSCPPQTFLNKDNTCVICQGKWDPISYQCLVCAQDARWDTTLQQCVCRNQFPHLKRNGTCVACLTDHFWSPSLDSCATCPTETIVSADQSKCICPSDRPYLTADQRCVSCQIGQIWNETLRICQRNSPLPNCISPLIWNSITSKCECPFDRPYLTADQRCVSCQIGQIWNETLRECKKYVPPIPTCIGSLIWNSATSRCQCPSDRPYLDQYNNCVSCFTTWDSRTRTCLECPLDRPFKQLNGNCIACPQPNYWDESTQICNRCPLGSKYNPLTRTCQCPTQRPYLSAENQCVACQNNQAWDQANLRCIFNQTCPLDKVYNTAQGRCVCASSRPYESWNGQCVSCLPPNTWVQAQKQCKQPYVPPNPTCGDRVWNSLTSRCQCPVDRPYTNNSNICVACPWPDYWDQSVKICQRCPLGLQYNPTSQLCQCSTDKPYLTADKQCVSCQIGQTWNQVSLKCISNCPADKVYSSSLARCVCSSFKPYQLWNGQCISCVAPNTWIQAERRCKQSTPPIPLCGQQIYNPITSRCQCPSERPYLDLNNKCVACPSPDYWDQSSKICNRCPLGLQYNPATKLCQCPTDRPYLARSNTCVACSGTWDSNSLTCIQCSSDKPYKAINGSCISCPAPDYWDQQAKVCIRCPLETQYNPLTKMCQCSADRPFLNKTNQCVACDSIWNSKTLTCVSQCPPDTHYDYSTRTCMAIHCQYPQYWDSQLLRCVECPDSQSKGYGQNGQCVCCPPTYIFDPVGFKCSCPSSKPYQINRTCKATRCDYPQYWDQELSQCLICPDSQSKGYGSNGQCVCCPATYLFDPVGFKCVCPVQTPNQVNKTCVACEPSFNWIQSSRKCQKCSSGQSYNASKRACQSTSK